MGVSSKWVKSKRRRKKKEERRAKVGDNNGQATHGKRKHAWRTQAAWAKRERKEERLKDGDNNCQAMHGARKAPGPKLLRFLKQLS